LGATVLHVGLDDVLYLIVTGGENKRLAFIPNRVLCRLRHCAALINSATGTPLRS